MSRINLSKVQEAINLATDAAIEKLASERRIDADHLDAHIKACAANIENLTEQENKIVAYLTDAHTGLVNGLKDMFEGMREEEQLRLASLQAHVQDIKDDSGEVQIEYVTVKRLTEK